MQTADYLKYLSYTPADEKWGVVCTTVGFQNVKPHMPYPVEAHPQTYNFTRTGRTLDEFQLVYIIEGNGYFQSESQPLCKVNPGTIIILFPGERHLYYPDPESGWQEYWVGFKMCGNSTFVDAHFSPREPLCEIGIRERLVELYNRIINYAKLESLGSQQVIGGIICHILGRIYYELANRSMRGNKFIDKINKAQILLRDNLATNLSPADVAQQLNMSYSSLRSQFKAVTGVSMSTFVQQQKLSLAKELLATSTKSISEIAYETGFESVSRFCCFFRQYMHITASDFRAQNTIQHKIK